MAAFRPHLTVTPLPLASPGEVEGLVPSTPVKDLHLQVNAHAGRTKNTAAIGMAAVFFPAPRFLTEFFYQRIRDLLDLE